MTGILMYKRLVTEGIYKEVSKKKTQKVIKGRGEANHKLEMDIGHMVQKH